MYEGWKIWNFFEIWRVTVTIMIEKEEVAISYYLMIPYSEWWKILVFHQKDEQETLNFLMHLRAWQEEALVHEIAKLLELFREKGGVDVQEDVKKLGNLFRTWLQANTYAKERNLNLTIHVLKLTIIFHRYRNLLIGVTYCYWKNPSSTLTLAGL